MSRLLSGSEVRQLSGARHVSSGSTEGEARSRKLSIGARSDVHGFSNSDREVGRYQCAKDFQSTASEKEPAWLKKSKDAFGKVSQGKDVVLIEGVSGFKASSSAAEALGAKAILVVRYQSDLDASQIVPTAKALGSSLLGAIINAVPQRKMDPVKTTLVPFLEKNGVKVLGVLPEDRFLLAVSVGELAELLGGNILNSPESAKNLVESVMVGAMSPDPAISYLSLKQNKAVVTRSDRADIQLAALATSTSCLVLPPAATILQLLLTVLLLTQHPLPEALASSS